MISRILFVLVALAGIARAQGPAGDPAECGGPPADANPATMKARAQEHYRRGQELHFQGEYDKAIEEFRASYCLFPLAETVSNIAAGYLNLLDYTKAVIWYEHYIRMLPESAGDERGSIANKVARLRKLPARVTVITEPTEATVILTDESGRVFRGKASEATPLKVPAGVYELRIQLPGYQSPRPKVIPVELGQPYTYFFPLRPETGMVRISTDPIDARVFVDDKLVPSTGGVAIADLWTRGEHTILVEAENRVPARRSVKVGAQDLEQLYIKLESQPRNGRTELLIGATTFGLTQGAVIGDAFLSSDTAALFSLAGGATTFIGTYVLAPRRIDVGKTSYIIGAAAYGGAEGVGAGLAIDRDDDTLVAALGASSSAAFAIGAALTADRFDPDAGDSALVNSGAMWGGATGLMTAGVFEEDRLYAPLFLAGLNAGLLAGVTLARRYDVSRTHVALIDLSGVAGLVAGLAVGGQVADETQTDRQLNFSLGGMAAGLVVGAILTRNFDKAGGPSRTAPVVTTQAAVNVAEAKDGERVPVVGVTGGF